MAFRSYELIVWSTSKQSMINQFLMLNKVCFVAKTTDDGMRWIDEPMGFCAQSADQKPILISRQNVFTNPLEHYNT